MFKNFKVTIVASCLFMTSLQASLQVAISIQDFCPGNSLVLIGKDGDGYERIAGCVSLVDGKTKFSHDEISQSLQKLSVISEQEQSQSAIITHTQESFVEHGQQDAFIYLYFDVDRDSIVRVLVIKNNLLADNPYDVLKFSTVSMLQDEDEEDFFGDDEFSCDEFSHLNLQDIQNTQSTPLSIYDTVVLSMYALWAVQSTKAKQAYKHLTQWLHD